MTMIRLTYDNSVGTVPSDMESVMNGSSIDWATAFATRSEGMRASEIRELLKLLDQPDIISFAGGIPDPALFPTQAFQDAYAAVLADPALGRQGLQYSVSEGYAPLRRWIAGYMASLDMPCAAENIVITCGSQQGLDFLGKLLISPGDRVLVSAPTYLGALQAFNPYEPRYEALSLDGPVGPGRTAFAYAVTDFANPTGETMSAADRLRLLALAEAQGAPLVEDAAYEALRFEGERVPSCLALDLKRVGEIDRSRVIYCGTFSKTVAPGLRVGWIAAAQPLVQKIVLAKQAGDLHSATLNQMVMHRVAEATHAEQVARITRVYAGRRDAMLRAMERHMPEGVRWTRPEGGMFLWVTLPEGLDGADLLAAGIAEERIAFVPGGAFFADRSGANTLRLNYSLQSEVAIEEGIGRLGRLVSRRLQARQAA